MFKSKFTDSSASFRAGYTSTDSTMSTDFNGLQVIKGEDGFSPIVDVTETEDGHIVTITDKESIEIFPVLNGITPTIKNGYWYIGDTNTNVPVSSQPDDGLGIKVELVNGIYTVSLRTDEEIVIDCGDASQYFEA